MVKLMQNRAKKHLRDKLSAMWVEYNATHEDDVNVLDIEIDAIERAYIHLGLLTFDEIRGIEQDMRHKYEVEETV